VDATAARTLLEVMLTDLERSISTLKGENSDPGAGGYDRHPADAGSNLVDADRVEAGLEALDRQRNAVLAALHRVETGTYGQCVDCGAPVPEGRLEARPEAARCVSCQAKYDRIHR
jgi:RNA polymerase-binding transcription factor DksA